MLKTLLMASILVTLVAGSGMAAETSGVAPEPAQPASAEVVLPAEITGQLTPEPTYRYGMKNGPCTVSVSCVGSYTIRCSGDSVCYWRADSTTYPRGFVECDGERTYCVGVN